MSTTEIIQLISITAGIPVFLIIVVGFFGKKLIEYFFHETIEIKKKQLEYENNKLQLEIDKKLESYKKELDLIKMGFQIQYSKLHEKRSEVIENLYKKLVNLHNLVLEQMAPIKLVIENLEKENLERAKNLDYSYNDFFKYYQETKIYFKPETCIILDKIRLLYFNNIWDYNEYYFLKKGNTPESIIQEYREKSKKASDFVRTEVPKVIEQLEFEFRQLLGV
ncbi:MAG: hypothetical protein A2W91_16805 [Bacteroidetes bacterium GWF2_38_335]|nr:MAG: hypothetical protein A2W91_16805 [Bacteroidetes bacterium GWF2_38_335]OFY81345.1 MAG: hypothetical protein A2281_07780 [Bacteroidetes bacterium RIFOXYA12_FULL_38_20]HBS85467.1 hypothetical protein [Bacteroidales bacterium]